MPPLALPTVPASSTLKVICLLTISNIFMNAAWYGHLKYRERALALVIFSAWGLAFFEYCFQVPANRLGSAFLSTPQLKIIQEAIALLTFGAFSTYVLRERITRYDLVALGLVLLAVAISVGQPPQARQRSQKAHNTAAEGRGEPPASGP